MKKIELLKQYDMKRLTKAGAVSTVVLRNMAMYDYYKGLSSIRNPVALTASRFGVDTRTVSNVIKDMQRPV